MDDSPNTLIIGENGAGKSTILDALTFSLFGKSFRKINKPGLVNSVNKKNCQTEIEFTSNNKKYKVIRGIKPAIFEVYCDGILLNQDADSKDYQETLEKFILNMNFKSFTQIVILGSASFTPFMQLSPADRRLVIEDLLDIQIFSVMNTIAKQKFADNREKIEHNKIEGLGKNETRDYILKTITSLRENDEDKRKELEEEKLRNESIIASLTKDIDQLYKQYRDALNCTTNIKALKSRNLKLISLKTQIETNKKRYSCDHSFFQNNDNCPTCKQSIGEQFKTQEIDKLTSKITELNDGLLKITSEIDSYVKQMEIIESKIEEADRLKSDISTKEIKCNQISQNVIKIQENIDCLGNSNVLLLSNQKDLEKIEKEINDLEEERKILFEEKKYIDTAISLLKDGGIKSRIIKQYLPVINKMINKYLSQMNFFVNFTLDENFDETIKSRYRDDFAYQNFSEGEKTRIDLALLLTWRAIAKLKNSASTNLLIFDEIFDSSLDESGTDEFLKIMWSLVGDTNVFVISHKDQMFDKFKKVYRFRKKKNFSVIS